MQTHRNGVIELIMDYMRRYVATLDNDEEFYVLATEHHEAAQEAMDRAVYLGIGLKDVCLDRGDYD